MSNGLVIGKFYPLHKGHEFLIRTAASQVDHLTVLVMGTNFDSILPADRVRHVHGLGLPNVQVIETPTVMFADYDSQSVWDAHNKIMQSHVKRNIDYVFTSEEYGWELAEAFNAKHVLVDLKREKFHVSATDIRNNLYGEWEYLTGPSRYHLQTRICVMGAESTGTTTLSNALGNYFRAVSGPLEDTRVVPEFGRKYAEDIIAETGNREIEWTRTHFHDIVQGQAQLINQAIIETESPLIVCDTDGIATEAFAPYYGVKDDEGMAFGHLASYFPADVYLITSHEGVPLEDDGSRLVDTERRDASTQNFIDTCLKYGLPFVYMTGDKNTRLLNAIKLTQRIMTLKSQFTTPI